MTDPLVRIRGAGPVGILAALFLEHYGWDKNSIELIDPAIASQEPLHKDDPRILALSHGTLLRLQHLSIDAPITRIKHIHVSAKGHFGVMEIKNERVGVGDLGGLIAYSSLLTELRKKIAALNIPIYPSIEEADAAHREASPHYQDIGVHVIAEGGVYARNTEPTASSTSGDMKLVRDYGQQAVIGWVWTKPAPSITAWERFIDNGAVALLPVNERYALIWCAANDHAQQFAQADQQEQIRMLNDVMGNRVRGIERIEITGNYPLGLKWRDTLAQGNTVWIGNSAQALHPVAGQGLNLGFRDAETLSTCLLQRGSTIAERLQDYAQRRQADRWTVRIATDTLARRGWVRRAIGGVALFPGAKKMLGQVLMYGG